MIKHILFLLLIPQILLFAQNYSDLRSIDSKAILMGDGDTDIYVFVDPLCRFSRKFMVKVTQNKMMLRKYKYHIFLYELPKLHSTNTINYIYNSPKKLQTLLDVMLRGNKVKHLIKPTKTSIKTVNDISNTAKKINVNKRPFIIINQGVN